MKKLKKKSIEKLDTWRIKRLLSDYEIWLMDKKFEYGLPSNPTQKQLTEFKEWLVRTTAKLPLVEEPVNEHFYVY